MSSNHLNRLQIELTKEEFLSKPVSEQNWILFQALVNIDKQGCRWARSSLRVKLSLLYAIGGIFGLIGGFVYSIIYRVFK